MIPKKFNSVKGKDQKVKIQNVVNGTVEVLIALIIYIKWGIETYPHHTWYTILKHWNVALLPHCSRVPDSILSLCHCQCGVSLVLSLSTWFPHGFLFSSHFPLPKSMLVLDWLNCYITLMWMSVWSCVCRVPRDGILPPHVLCSSAWLQIHNYPVHNK